jgi:DNA-binding Lrp family transcriptional regulator
MDPLLDLLKKDARESDDVLAQELNTTPEDVRSRIAAYRKEGVIRAFQAVLDTNKVETTEVHAVIEMHIRPEREGGFDRMATRISKFDHVESLYLMSGGFDLLLFVKGKSLQEVADFVSARLAPLDGVLSTATHFMLKTYKDNGVLMEGESHDDRLQVCP